MDFDFSREAPTLMATTAIRIGPADHGRAMTLEEFRDADEEPGYRYELARGVLEVTEVPNDPHGQIVSHLYDAIAAYKREHPDVILRYGGAGEFRLWLPGMISGRNPDVAVVLRGTPKNLRGRRPPAFAAEVVSEGGETRDYQTKRQEYLVFGLLEYWIVDPRAHRVTTLVRDGDVWAERVYNDPDILGSMVLPGLQIRVADLWIDAEPDEDETD
jgi:Uma2 family endonuclease